MFYQKSIVKCASACHPFRIGRFLRFRLLPKGNEKELLVGYSTHLGTTSRKKSTTSKKKAPNVQQNRNLFGNLFEAFLGNLFKTLFVWR